MQERSLVFPPIGSLPLRGRAGVGLTDSGVDVVEITRVGVWRHIGRVLGGLHCPAGMQANPTPTLSRCGRWRVLQGRG